MRGVLILSLSRFMTNSISTWSETEKSGLVSQNSTGGAKSFRSVRSSGCFLIVTLEGEFSVIQPEEAGLG